MRIRDIGCALIVGWAGQVCSQPAENDELSLSFGDEEFVTIATGQREHISKAPAVASVITAEDIQAMGATDINDVLETIPGLHVSVSSINYNPIYVMRGIYSEFNPHVLFLVNGIPITHLQFGDRGQYWGGMPVEGIARIEVLRGPGSAVYGADAYSGIVNIITKNTENLDGLEVGARSGTDSTNDVWFLYGEQFDEWKFSSYIQSHVSDGIDETIESDSQTFFDGLFGTTASLAPGSVNSGVESIEARFDLSNKNWALRLGYQDRSEVGMGAGVAVMAISPPQEEVSFYFPTG
jgi:outer membrane receptor for ferrienterochelin and colicins